MIPDDDPSIGVLRTPPSSLEAESCVLGGLLLDNSAWDRVSDLLTDGDFYRFEHREIYAAIGAMVNALKPADVFTVADRLAGMGKDVGGIDYLNAPIAHLAAADHVVQCPQGLFEIHSRKVAVQVVDVDMVGLQSPQAAFEFPQHPGP